MVTILQYGRHGLLINNFRVEMAAVSQKRRVGGKFYILII